MAVVEVRGLRARPPGDVPLAQVDLEVREFEVVGLVGPGSRGLLDCISGHTRARAGSVRHRGVDVTRWRPHRRARAGVARTFRGRGLLGSGTALEAVMTAQDGRIRYSALAGMLGSPSAAATEREVARRAHALLELVGLPEALTAAADRLDGEPRCRLQLATALATDPDVLLLDTPSHEVPSDRLPPLRRLLERVRRDLGITVVLADERLALDPGGCDYLYALDRGRVIARGAPADVLHSAAFRAWRLGEEDVDARP